MIWLHGNHTKKKKYIYSYSTIRGMILQVTPQATYNWATTSHHGGQNLHISEFIRTQRHGTKVRFQRRWSWC